MKTDIRTIGTSGEHVVILDDFHPHPDYLLGLAEQSAFGTLGPHYPGVQAHADPAHLTPVQNELSKILRSGFGLIGELAIVQCSFSIVTKRGADLDPIQRLPHVDTVDPGRVALLHYLSADGTGTAFYRHRASGFEVLTAANFDEYKTAVSKEGLPKPGYMSGSDDRYEQIGEVQARPNRAVLYRSALLHSGIIPDGTVLSDDPARGRLTLNTFFQHQGEV